MMERFEDSLGAMEGNMAQRLSRFEKRLESLETVVSALLLNYACVCMALFTFVLKYRNFSSHLTNYEKERQLLLLSQWPFMPIQMPSIRRKGGRFQPIFPLIRTKRFCSFFFTVSKLNRPIISQFVCECSATS